MLHSCQTPKAEPPWCFHPPARGLPNPLLTSKSRRNSPGNSRIEPKRRGAKRAGTMTKTPVFSGSFSPSLDSRAKAGTLPRALHWSGWADSPLPGLHTRADRACMEHTPLPPAPSPSPGSAPLQKIRCLVYKDMNLLLKASFQARCSSSTPACCLHRPGMLPNSFNLNYTDWIFYFFRNKIIISTCFLKPRCSTSTSASGKLTLTDPKQPEWQKSIRHSNLQQKNWNHLRSETHYSHGIKHGQSSFTRKPTSHLK